MYCPFAHLKRSLLCLFIHLTILISIQHRKRRANIQMNSIYHALFDVQDKITWEMVKRLRRSFDSRFRREEKNIVQNNAFFPLSSSSFIRHGLCIIEWHVTNHGPLKIMIDFTFWHLCNNTIEPEHCPKKQSIFYSFLFTEWRWPSLEINLSFLALWHQNNPRILNLILLELQTWPFGGVKPRREISVVICNNMSLACANN